MKTTSNNSLTTPVSLVAAPFTPLKADGTINFDLFESYAERLQRDGVTGVFVGGTSGEGMSLTLAERIELATHWKRVTEGRLRFIVHVGHASVAEATVLARHAARLPADAIAAIGPTFFTAATVESLVAYCETIASAAPELPFYYYHMPSMSRVPLQASALLIELAKRIPSFRGIKFTHEDLPDYARCLKLAEGRYEIFFGRDEILLEGLREGARSAVGSTYNFAAPLYLRMAEAWAAHDEVEAKRIQSLCASAIEVMVRYGGLVGIKATLSFLGLDCGAPRLPLQALSPTQMESLSSELEDLGFFEELALARGEAVIADKADLVGQV